MTFRRDAATAAHDPEATGHHDERALTLPITGEMTVSRVLVAGGLLGFTPEELFT